MKKTSLILSIVFTLPLLGGWSGAAQSKQDSLLFIWNNRTLPDTSRLKAIDQLSLNLIEVNPDSAIYYAEIQYKHAMAKGLLKNAADALDGMGQAYEAKGELLKASEYYNRALKQYEETGNKKKTAYVLNNIGWLKWTEGKYIESIAYHRKSLAIAQAISDRDRESKALGGIAYSYFQQGQYATAMQHVQKKLKICEEIEDEYCEAWCLDALGVFYSRQGNFEKELEYYTRAMEMREAMDDQLSLSYSIRNVGGTYEDLGDDEKALELYERSLAIDTRNNDKRGISISLSTIGSLKLKQGDYQLALDYFQGAYALSKEIGNKDMQCEDLHNVGTVYLEQGVYSSALIYCKESYEIALEIGSIVNQRWACDCLFESNKALGRFERALVLHEQMTLLDDSINDAALAENLRQMEFENYMLADSIKTAEEKMHLEMAYKLEVSEKEKSRNMYMAGGAMLLFLAIGLYGRNRYVQRAKNRIEIEKNRSENLLLNILPEEIAQELKEKGRAEARDFELVSILFTDFKGFTQASAKMSAQDLVSEINFCFEAFDGIMEKYGIEKIKTIGDAYMAAGGLPVPADDSVKNTVLAALEMQAFIVKRKNEFDAQISSPLGRPGGARFEMRVGIHTGPVVAGIVGVKKFQYDIWGDTVNTASRMESSGEVGKVNISQATYELLKDDPDFAFESRGKIEAKGKGEMEMWFVQLKNKQ